MRQAAVLAVAALMLLGGCGSSTEELDAAALEDGGVDAGPAGSRLRA